MSLTGLLVVLPAIPGLFEAWTSGPLDRLAPLAASLWLLAVTRPIPGESGGGDPGAAWRRAALLLAVVGQLTTLRAIGQLAVALWLGGARGPLAVISAASWLPVTGWILAGWPASGVGLLRLALAALPLAIQFRLDAGSPR